METSGDGWTLRSLKFYFDQRFSLTERALDKAETALNYRLENLNRAREQLERERSHYVTVEKHDELDERIDELRRNYVSNDKFDAFMQRQDERLGGYERWQNKMVGALVLIGLVIPAISSILVYLATQHHL